MSEFNTTQGSVTIPDVTLGSHCRYVVRGCNSHGPELYAVDVPYPNGRSWSGIAPPGPWFIRVYAEYVGRRFTAQSAWTVVVVR